MFAIEYNASPEFASTTRAFLKVARVSLNLPKLAQALPKCM